MVALVRCLLASCVVQHKLGPLRHQGSPSPFQGECGNEGVPGRSPYWSPCWGPGAPCGSPGHTVLAVVASLCRQCRRLCRVCLPPVTNPPRCLVGTSRASGEVRKSAGWAGRLASRCSQQAGQGRGTGFGNRQSEGKHGIPLRLHLPFCEMGGGVCTHLGGLSGRSLSYDKHPWHQVLFLML